MTSPISPELALFAWTQVWQVTVVAVVVGLLVRLAARQRPHLAYLLWMLVIVKAVTPPLLASPSGLFSWALRQQEVRATTVPAQPAAFPRAALPPDEPLDESLEEREPRTTERTPARNVRAIEEQPRSYLPEALFALWFVGFTGLSTYVGAKWLKRRRLWSRAPSPPAAELEQQLRALAVRLGVRRPLRLIVTRYAATPAVTGLWRATFIMPQELLQSLSAEQVELVLAHELLHVRRGDPAAALLQLFAQLVWWFHPLIWWANREARRERERSCDEEVVAALGCRPADYARTLVRVLESQPRRVPAFAMPGVGMLGLTAMRLEHLLRPAGAFHRRTPRSYYGVALVALAVMLPGAGLTAVADPPPAAAKPPVAEDELPQGSTGVFVPARITKDANFVEPKTVALLRALGAQTQISVDNGGRHWLAVTLTESWQGTDSDLKLLEDIGELNLSQLYVDFAHVQPAGLSQLKLKRPLENLLLANVSDDTLEEWTALPGCRNLVVVDADLAAASYRKLALLTPGVMWDPLESTCRHASLSIL